MNQREYIIKYLLFENWEIDINAILYKVQKLLFLHVVSSRHLTQSPYFLLNFNSTRDTCHLLLHQVNVRLCARKKKRNRANTSKGTEKLCEILVKILCRKRLPRYTLPVSPFYEESSRRRKEVINDEFHSV